MKNGLSTNDGLTDMEYTSVELLGKKTDTSEVNHRVRFSERTCFSQRWILAYMGLWMGMMLYIYHSNMSIAVVCMSRQVDDVVPKIDDVVHNIDDIVYTGNLTNEELVKKYEVKNFSSHTSRCQHQGNGKLIATQGAEFDWDKKTQSYVLSGYFYGYMTSQIPAGWLASRFGGKRVVGIAMSLSCLLSLLTPVLARTSVYLLVVVRILQGLFNGTCNPSFCGLVGAWALPKERSRFMALCWFGQMAGSMVGYLTAGVLCAHGFDNGWPSIFYVHGGFGALFVVCWWFFVHNSPTQHPRISAAEQKLLSNNVHCDKHSKKDSIPWRKILTYPPIYIMYITHVCDTWTFYMLLSCLPQFLKEVLMFDIQSNGLFSSLPFITLMIGIAFSGVSTDYLRTKTTLSITKIRKLYLITGFLGVAGFIVIPGFLSCEQRDVIMVCLCLCTLFEACAVSGGYISNSVDIAPRYASVVFGISNTLASIPGIVTPMIVAEITKNKTSEEWRIVFFISSGVSIFGAIIYGLFSNSEVAKWADIHIDTELEVVAPDITNDDKTET